MRLNINNEYYIDCTVYSNSRHWGHKAELYKNGYFLDTICFTYYNRTWERYQFESILVAFAYRLDERYKEIPLKDRIAFYNKIKE